MSLFSLRGGCGAGPLLAVAGRRCWRHFCLIQEGSLQAVDADMPMMMAMGGQLQMLGRVLNVAKPPPKYYKAIFVVGLANAVIAGLIMSMLVRCF